MQAHLVLLFATADPCVAAFHQKRREVLAVHFGEDHKEVGEAAVGDPHLLAAQHIAAVILSRGARLCAQCVGAGA